MAVAYLNSGATSLASANWSDSTGFADDATLVINDGTQSIQTGLTAGLTNGVSYLDILEGFSGTIGGSGGSLSVQTRASLYSETTAAARVRYWASGGSIWYTGETASTDTCHFWQQRGGGSAHLTGAFTLRNIHLESGTLSVAENVAGESTYTWLLAGGAATIDYSATGTYTVIVSGGSHVLKRGVQTGITMASGSLTVDAQGGAVAAVNGYGGNVTWLNSGTITVAYLHAGTYDFSRLQRPLTITTLWDSPAAKIIPSKLLTIGTRKPFGSGAVGLT